MDDKQAAADAELANLKARAEARVAAAEARAVDAEKKLQDAQSSAASSAAWLEQHLASIQTILPQ